MAPTSIGRFRVGKTLGSGNQGTVYLCEDPELQRPVAVKLLNQRALGSEEVLAAFYREARSMSKVQHPNIVSIYEAGHHENLPYLVFEYVEGRLLAEVIRRRELDLDRGLELFQGMLEGMDRAHRQGIVHRDLKPANIIISSEGVPKVMDFGIARVLSGPTGRLDSDDQLIGSPRYMAPEYVQRGEVGTQSDVFALGLILDEMLTGMPAFPGDDPHAVLESVVHDQVPPPSRFNPRVDERLDRIVLKALEKDPGARYRDAGELLELVRGYREPPATLAPTPAPGEGRGTLEFLLRRMQRKSDFPALAQSIRTLNAMADTSDKSVNDMAQVVVKDFALTSKILKVVNSAYFGHFAGKIGTVSRAVVLLGINPIRSLAASLIFFEHLHDKTRAQELRAQTTAALYSAVLAGNLGAELDPGRGEEHFLSAMLQNLGRILVSYYLPDEAGEMRRLTDQGMVPLQAQRMVLGMTFEEVGIGIGRQWNFPEDILRTLRVPPVETQLKPPKGLEERRRVVAGFANDTAAWVGSSGLEDEAAQGALLRRYGKALGLDSKRLGTLLAGATKEFFKLVEGALPGGVKDDPFVQRLRGRVDAARAHKEAGRAAAPGEIAEAQAPTPALAAVPGAEPLPADRILTDTPLPAGDSEALLTEGLQEVTGLLLSRPSLTQLCSVVLETMYRAMAFQRVLLCLRDRTGRFVEAKLGFGEGVDGYLKGFRFTTQWEPDVFHAALKNGVDIYISRVRDPRIQSDLPGWYTQLGEVGAFLLFPVVVKQRPLGLIYGDHTQPEGLQITPKTLNLLKALRNQLVLGLVRRA
jgi:eukaryotic-like serine/threonine-protein kinase